MGIMLAFGIGYGYVCNEASANAGSHFRFIYVGTSSRNGRLNTLGHFEKKAYKVLLWLQPYQSACMPCNGIHCYQTGSQNYLIGWAGQLMKLLPLINLLLPA